MFGRRTKAGAVGKAARGAGKALKSRPARSVTRGATRGAGKAALKASKAQARLTGRALSSREPASASYLKYGLFAIAGFAVGALVARLRSRGGDTSTETWGSGTSTGTAGGGDSVAPSGSTFQQPEDPNRTGAEREYSDPSAGPLVGRRHQPNRVDVPEQQEEIENRIRTGVGEDPRTLDIPRLNVEVNEGVADIRGEVHSEEEKQAVEEIAANTEGVTEVRNLLTVNPEAPRRRDKAAGGDEPA